MADFSTFGAIGAYFLIREMIRHIQENKSQTPILGLPAAGVPAPAPPAAAPLYLPDPDPPLTLWAEPRELLAWRAWRLVWYRSDIPRRGGLCLISLSAPCIWEGPVVSGGMPLLEAEPQTGIYALKTRLERSSWQQSEHCWVTGDVALLGRVVEHQFGYRAERAVVRSLRLGVGTHLAVRSLNDLRDVMIRLEIRYQVTVDVGQSERETADRMLSRGFTPEFPSILPVVVRPPWRLI